MTSEAQAQSTIVPRKIEKRNRKQKKPKNKILVSAGMERVAALVVAVDVSSRYCSFQLVTAPYQNLCSGFLCFLFLVFFLIF